MANSSAVVPIGILNWSVPFTVAIGTSVVAPLGIKANQRESITTTVIAPLGVLSGQTSNPPAKMYAYDEESHKGYADLKIGATARIVVEPAVVSPPS